MEMEPADKSSPEQQKPFWDSTQPPEDVTEPQPEVQSVSPPQAQMVGNLGQQQSTHFYATVNNPAQYSSASSITTGYDMTEKKAGMNWKQFAIGFFAPIVIMILLSTLSEVANEDWDDRWDDVHHMEMVTMSSDNGTFTHTFSEEVTDYGRFEVNWCNSMNWEDEYEYHCDWGYNSETSDKDIIEVKNTGQESEVVVGEYTQHNRTIWFSTDSHNSDEIEFEFEFKDRELEMELDEKYMGGGGAADMVDTFFCLMPLIGIGA
ncbi:MAG: hypothetical protein OR994_07230, partial [Candidatus Poseidoniales archaeon]|nr:hypothetical protein [Candidatus Poseidoniales archaeon]